MYKYDSKFKAIRRCTSRLGYILLALCCIDTIVTVCGIHLDYFYEASPFLGYFWERFGLRGLVMCKMFFVVTPLLVFEFFSKYDLVSQRRIRFFYKIAICIYTTFLTAASMNILLAAP